MSRLRRVERLAAVALCLCVGAPAVAAEGSLAHLVDRLSGQLDRALDGAGTNTGDRRFRPFEPAAPGGARARVVAAKMGGARTSPAGGTVSTITVDVQMQDAGPRLLLVDAGALFVAADGAAWYPVPNQQIILDAPRKSVALEVLPLTPDTDEPAAGTPLSAVWSNDAGVIAVLRTAHRIEAEDTRRLKRYLRPAGDGYEVATAVQNQDVRLARWMAWDKDLAGQPRGRLPRDAIRIAVFAVSAGYTITETTDWIRSHRAMDMEPAVADAWKLAPQVELILERAGLNHRVFSPEHADFHFNVGVKAYRHNDLKKAESAFRAAIDRRNKMVTAHFNLGVTLYRAGRYDEASEAFKLAGGFAAADGDTYYNKGATLFRLDRRLDAARAFRDALKKNPQDPDAARWLAIADPDDVTKPKPPKKRRRRSRRGRR
jgi:hypothetical protein